MTKVTLTFDPKDPKSISKTKQQFEKDSNINNIIGKYKNTGVLPTVNGRKPFFGDFSEVQDYQSNLQKIKSINNVFMQLPAKVRAHFKNDPAEALNFVADPGNRDKAIELGLIEPLTPEQIVEEAKNKPNQTVKEPISQ